MLLGLLLACGQPAGPALDPCACWPVCAGLPELREALGWLRAAELVQLDGESWCRCAGDELAVWVAVDLAN